jgi:hypothetical protein
MNLLLGTATIAFALSVSLGVAPRLARAGTGACCNGDECQVLDESVCLAEGYQYLGDGTDCDPNPCAPLGACCDRFGTCSIQTEETEDDCDSASEQMYWKEGEVCDPNPCVGACCDDTGTCIVTSQFLCLVGSFGRVYLGDETTCDPNPCEPHIGACCYGEGQCAVATRWECEVDCGCEYQGDGTVCDPNPCEATPIDRRTWGIVKKTYR